MDFGTGLQNAVGMFSEAVGQLSLDTDNLPDLVNAVVHFAGGFVGLWAVFFGIRALIRAARSVR